MEHSSHENRTTLRRSPSDGTLRERGDFKAADGQISVSNQHLIVHVDKERLVTQTRGLRNQLTSKINSFDSGDDSTGMIICFDH
jgi:hypothetical protein